MFKILTELGISKQIQEYLSGTLTEDGNGTLIFFYGEKTERFTKEFTHSVPTTKSIWLAGNVSYSIRTKVFIGYSAMECIAHLALNDQHLRCLDEVVLIATGNLPTIQQALSIQSTFPLSKFTLIYSNDLFGLLADIVIATGIHRIPVALAMDEGEIVTAIFRNEKYRLNRGQLSLHTFRKYIKMTFNARTKKPLGSSSYLDLLIKRSDQLL